MPTANELRNTLHDVMQDLKAGKISVDQAKAIADVAQVIVNSAKVEVDMVRAIESVNPMTEFFGDNPSLPKKGALAAIR